MFVTEERKTVCNICRMFWPDCGKLLMHEDTISIIGIQRQLIYSSIWHYTRKRQAIKTVPLIDINIAVFLGATL